MPFNRHLSKGGYDAQGERLLAMPPAQPAQSLLAVVSGGRNLSE